MSKCGTLSADDALLCLLSITRPWLTYVIIWWLHDQLCGFTLWYIYQVYWPNGAMFKVPSIRIRWWHLMAFLMQLSFKLWSRTVPTRHLIPATSSKNSRRLSCMLQQLAVLRRSTATQQVVFVGYIECSCTAVITCCIDPCEGHWSEADTFWDNEKSGEGQFTVEEIWYLQSETGIKI